MFAPRVCVDVATLGIFERWRSTMIGSSSISTANKQPNESELGHLRSICDTIATVGICRNLPLASTQEILTTAMVAMEARWRREVATVHRKKATDRLSAALAAEPYVATEIRNDIPQTPATFCFAARLTPPEKDAWNWVTSDRNTVRCMAANYSSNKSCHLRRSLQFDSHRSQHLTVDDIRSQPLAQNGKSPAKAETKPQ